MAKQEGSSRRPRSSGKDSFFSGRSDNQRPFNNRSTGKKPFSGKDEFNDRPKRDFSSDRPFNREDKSDSFDRRPSDRQKPNRNGFERKQGGSDERPKRSFSSDRNEGKAFRSKDSFDHKDRKDSFSSDRPKHAFSSDRSEKKPFRSNDFSNRRDRKDNFSSEHPNRNGNRSEGKPFRSKDSESFSSERRFNREDKPFGDKPRFDKRKAFEKGERSESERKFEKKPFEKKSTPKHFGKRSDHDETRPFTRRFDTKSESDKVKNTPNYDLERFKENAPEKLRKKIDRTEQEKNSDTVRLNRFIALSGVCSRRDADRLIESGEISVNGKVITELGFQVKAGSVVRYGRKVLNPEKMVYVLLNKPKDYITTVEDDRERRTVMELVKEAADQRIYPIGRLDRNTTGLLLLTNDGELAEKLTHPSNQIEKIYQVEIDKPITTEDFEALKKGVELEDGFIKPDELSIITPDAQVIGIRIHSGRNRIVRRIFEKFGYDVTKLDRTVFAGLNKKDLPRGQWRYLTQKEVIRLKYLLG
ncbi:MAG: pseudouridine synthase [Siphonobacter sp.]